MALSAQKIIVRIGMSEEVPGMDPGEVGWDMDLARLRVGDGSPSPTIIMTNKSKGPFEYNFIQYAQYPEIRMLPEGTVDGVDISDLNRENGLVTRIGDNLWAHRELTNTDGYVTITYPDGVANNPIINFSADFTVAIGEFLKFVAVDDITIHGNGTVAAPLYAQIATFTLRGVIRIATLAEVNAGVDTTTAVCPAYLKNYVANNSSEFGAILKGSNIATFDVDDQGNVNLAGRTCAVLIIQGSGGLSSGGAAFDFGFLNIRVPSSTGGDYIPMNFVSSGSTGAFFAICIISLFKATNNNWYGVHNGVAWLCSNSDNIGWDSDGGSGVLLSGTPLTMK